MSKSGTGQGLSGIWLGLGEAISSLAGRCQTGVLTLRQPVTRRRCFIVVAAILVCLYALGVLWYVVSIPDIGLRCAFSPVVNRSFDEFICVPDGEPVPDLEGYTIVRLGNQKVETWPQLLRMLIDLRGQDIQADYGSAMPSSVIKSIRLQETTRWLAPLGGENGVGVAVSYAAAERLELSHVRLDEAELVRVQLQKTEGQPADGPVLSVWCRLGISPRETLAPSILWFFLQLGLFAVGALVFWKRPEDRSAGLFFLLCIVTFGAYLGGYHWWRIVTQPVLLLIFMVCSILLPACSLHFYLLFPRPKAFFQRRPGLTLLAIYGLPVVFLVILITGYLGVRWLYHGSLPPDNLAAVRLVLFLILKTVYIYFGVAALWYLASIVCLIHSYWTAADITERNQVKWILFGALAALVPIGYTLYLAFQVPADFGGGGATWWMFAASVCFTAAFTISITRYRLMQLDQIISSGMVYFLLSFLAGLVYFSVVFIGTLFIGTWSPTSLNQTLAVSVAALVLMLVLDWLRGRFKRALDRRFYREKYQLDRTLRRMSQAIEQLVDPPALARRLLQASAELLGVPRGAVYLRDGEPPLYRLADSLGETPPLTELSSGCPLVETLIARGTLVARPQTKLAMDPAQRQLLFLGGEVAHALVHEGQMQALLILGPKDLGFYGADDLNLLAAFAQITALALESAQGHRTVETLNQDLQAKVAKISEQQRRILALQSQLMKQGSGIRDQELGSTTTDPRSLVPDSQSPIPNPSSGMVGSSPHVRQLHHWVRKVSASTSAVLIRGESGTGKELLARALHENSPRSGKAFVKVHCAALSPGLLESELFGHVKGAFTGAHRDKIGRFELANGGTIFLDEIGDISLEVQTKLLRVLQEMMFERVGSSEPVRVDVRVIAATHQNLEQLITQGRFREDLYYRLNVISIPVPPLRERREDIIELALHFLRCYAQRGGKVVTQIDDDALAALKGFHWPGNIRQLENVLERAVVVAEGPTITIQELPPEILLTPDGAAGRRARAWPGEDDKSYAAPFLGVQAERADKDHREREQLVRALAAAKGNKAEAARALGLARSTLLSRLKKHGLS